MSVAVLGASGFIGQAVAAALAADGHDVRPIRAPRLREEHTDVHRVAAHAVAAPQVTALAAELEGCSVVVNAAGLADPGSSAWATIAGANGLLPGVVFAAATRAGVGRVIHVSSMAVQGRREILDESTSYASFSPYSQSKQLGEQVLLQMAGTGGTQVVILRPGSVHGAKRATTRALVRFAGSRLSSVAGDGTQPTPQNLLQNVAGAVVLLVESLDPPQIVLQPWEGTTAGGVLRALGGREPHHVPSVVARVALAPVRLAGMVNTSARAWSRRLDLLWLGQRQAPGYLDTIPYQSNVPAPSWSELVQVGAPNA